MAGRRRLPAFVCLLGAAGKRVGVVSTEILDVALNARDLVGKTAAELMMHPLHCLAAPDAPAG